MTQYWILKSEPETFSFNDLLKNGWTHWDGVRNYQARNNLKAMQVGDIALFYHSISDKSLVGVCKITQTAYPDPTEEIAKGATPKWVAVRVEPIGKLNQPVELQAIKEDPQLSEIALIKQSRLSVIPIKKSEFDYLLKLSQTPLQLAI
jgi:predicted RNA-binding protein with PUA-like domain